MSIFGRPFTAAQIRYFEHEQLDQARAWLAAESSPVAMMGVQEVLYDR
jgi:hypothetical protein